MLAAIQMPTASASPVSRPSNKKFSDLPALLRNGKHVSEVFARLPFGAWVLFTHLMAYFCEHDEVYPTQKSLAIAMGISVESVRRHTRPLERAHIVSTRPHRVPGHQDGLIYQLEADGYLGLEQVTEGRARAKALRLCDRPPEAPVKLPGSPPDSPVIVTDSPPEAPVKLPGSPPDTPVIVSGSPPDTPVKLTDDLSEILKQNSFLNCAEPERAGEPAVAASAEPTTACPHRAIAVEALGYHFTKRHPGLRAPKLFNAAILAMVIDRVEQTVGLGIDLGHAQRLAIDAANAASMAKRGQPATATFIWGNPEFFAAHLERGRAGERPKVAKAKVLASPGDDMTMANTRVEQTPVAIAENRVAPRRGRMSVDMTPKDDLLELLLSLAERETNLSVRSIHICAAKPLLRPGSRPELVDRFARLHQE